MLPEIAHVGSRWNKFTNQVDRQFDGKERFHGSSAVVSVHARSVLGNREAARRSGIQAVVFARLSMFSSARELQQFQSFRRHSPTV